jgi:endonuclease-3
MQTDLIEERIRDRLVERGQVTFRAPREMFAFTKDREANLLLNDLDKNPHAFVLACVMDRQVKAEKAWLIPYAISERLGAFSFEALSQLTVEETKRLMGKPTPLHRFVDTMGGLFWSAIRRISHQYGGDASRIWAGKPPSAEVVYRFLEFDGVGPKIASMAVNLLARNFKVPLADHYSIDISADVHVRRVFGRLGLCSTDATTEQLIYKARALFPSFPGIMDSPCWEVGRSWCRPRDPLCNNCYLQDLCPAASGCGK